VHWACNHQPLCIVCFVEVHLRGSAMVRHFLSLGVLVSFAMAAPAGDPIGKLRFDLDIDEDSLTP